MAAVEPLVAGQFALISPGRMTAIRKCSRSSIRPTADEPQPHLARGHDSTDQTAASRATGAQNLFYVHRLSLALILATATRDPGQSASPIPCSRECLLVSGRLAPMRRRWTAFVTRLAAIQFGQCKAVDGPVLAESGR